MGKHTAIVRWSRGDGDFAANTYEDQAVGVMGKNPAGRMAITRVTLNPVVSYEGPVPSADQIEALHHEAHELCFIANSTMTEITTNTASS